MRKTCKRRRTPARSLIKEYSDKIDVNTLKEEGMLQYFYHSPLSKLPVRDVSNELGKDHKTEPHIEIGAENYLLDCYQHNIQRFLLSDAKYLFLLTTCRNKQLNQFGDQYIVGYIIKEDWGYAQDKGRKNSIFVRGSTKLFEFRYSISSKELFGKNLDRGGIMHNLWIKKEKTTKILMHLNRHPSIPIKRCIQEINRLDKKGETCYFGKKCKNRKHCLRFK